MSESSTVPPQELIKRLREYAATGHRSWNGIADVFRDAANEIERLSQIEERAQRLYDYAQERGGMGDQTSDCRYILHDEGLWVGNL